MEKHLNLDLANRFLQNRHLVDVTIYSSIDEEAAEVLSGYRGSILPLMSLKTITSSVAESLSKYSGGHLDLSGLTILGDYVAEKLGGHVGILDLSGIKKLSEAEAISLGKHKGRLYLSGLTSMCVEVAKGLSACDGDYIELSSLEELGGDAANRLSRFPNRLKLGSRCLSLEAAIGLSDHSGELVLESVESFDDDVLYHLSRHKGSIEVKSPLKAITETRGYTAFIKKLVQHDSIKSVSGLTNLTDSVSEIISRFSGDIILIDLPCLTDTAAEHLSSHIGGSLNLSGLKELSDTAAEHLSRHQGRSLILSGLKQIGEKTAQHLSRHGGESLDLSGLIELSDVSAESLSRYKGGMLDLSGMRELSEYAAARLARNNSTVLFRALRRLEDNKGHLELLERMIEKGSIEYLYCLEYVGDLVAQKISGHIGSKLNLVDLIELNDTPGHLRLAEALFKSEDNRQRLYLNLLEAMGDEIASCLSRNNQWEELYLGSLKSLDDCPGHLSFIISLFRNNSLEYLNLRGLQRVGDLCKFLLVEFWIHAERKGKMKLILPFFIYEIVLKTTHYDRPFTGSDGTNQDYSRIFTPNDDTKDEDLPF